MLANHQSSYSKRIVSNEQLVTTMGYLIFVLYREVFIEGRKGSQDQRITCTVSHRIRGQHTDSLSQDTFHDITPCLGRYCHVSLVHTIIIPQIFHIAGTPAKFIGLSLSHLLGPSGSVGALSRGSSPLALPLRD